MDKKFKVQVNNSSEFLFNKKEITALDTKEVSPFQFHVLQKNRSFKAQIIKSDFLQRKYIVVINSSKYEVDISSELDLLIKEMGLSLGSSRLVNDIKAPMPGLILEINFKEGDEVKKGDYLLVLEAMKMENTLSAPADGVVKSVFVEKGQTVEKNQLLIEME